MDFNKEEKLQKERARIRIASQKTRQKRREEERNLRTENEQMKRERLALLSKLEELEETLNRLQEQLEDKDEERSENEQLCRELQHYKDFGSACVMIGDQFELGDEQFSEALIEERILEQMTSTGGEMADLQAERILAEALNSGGKWHPLAFDTHIHQVASCVQGRYRIHDDGSCEWQFSICVPVRQYNARYFADKYRALWHDPRPMISIFGQSGGWCRNIQSSRVEELASSGPARLQRIQVESSQSWVFVLTAQDGIPVARSVLVPSSPLLLPRFAIEEPTATKGSSTPAPPETNRIGLVNCWTGTRASIMLDSSTSERESCVKGKFLESFRAWDDELHHSDPQVSGRCVRAVLVLSASHDFAIETFGDQGFNAIIDFKNHRIAPAYQNFINFIAMSMGLDRLPLPH
jgi:hypothetical protein